MNTVKGIARAVVASPRALTTICGALSSVLAFLWLIVRSETRLDDAIVASVCAVFVAELYVMHDWFVDAMQMISPPSVRFRIPVQRRLAALTIDDVPLLNKATHLKEVLDVLKENKVKATLMIMSGFVHDSSKGGLETEEHKRCRELLKEAVAYGHELGNHLAFDRPAIAQPPEEFDRDFHHCDELIADLHGGEKAWRARPCRWFRPASALWNQRMLDTAHAKGYTTAIASAYPWDHMEITRHINAQYLLRRVRPGAIVVVHDRWHTPETLRRALPMILASGMELGTLSDLQAASDAEGAKQSRTKKVARD